MSTINYNNTTPAAPSGNANVTWQSDGSGNISAYTPNRLAPIIGSSSTVALTGTIYIPISGGFTSSTETNVNIESPAVGVISNLYVQLSMALGGGNSAAFTLRKNGVSTSLTCTISGASSTTANDITHTVSIAEGDLLDIMIVPTGTIVVSPNIMTSMKWTG